MMTTLLRAFAAAAVILVAGCISTPLRQIPPKMPEAGEDVMADAANGGRVQSIAVNPWDRNNAIIAMQFGGMWKTYNAGQAWFRIYTLPALYVTDVEYGADGNTVVATVFRDNQTQAGGGGGIYVSRTNGDFWSRPPTGIVPTNAWTTVATSAYAVSRAPDERGLWYAGTDFGVAISRDDGNTWTHTSFAGSLIQSVLAFPGGIVLAMDTGRVWRSDDRGANWRVVITDDFSQFAPMKTGIAPSGNKMDRSPLHPWAFIFKEFHEAPPHGSGKLWFYELDTDTATPLALPQGRSRGPFVRVSKDDLFGGNHIRLWVGTGWDGYYVIREDAASIRALRSTAEFDDWVSFIAEAGIHADMGDLGLDSDAKPAYLSSDGGIYKPRSQPKWWEIGGQHKWMSAAKPGSGMNSLQISDLAGTNVHTTNGITTTLYISTQDNRLYTSPDGGVTWKVGDGREGFGLEGRADAPTGESAQIGFVGIGGQQDTFADANVVNKRPVSKLDENGVALDGFQNPYFVGQQPGTNASNWVRRRVPTSMPITEVFFSNNSGDNWRKFATANFKFAGEVRTAGTVAWLPVFLGGPNNEVGLVPLSTSTAPGIPPPIYDDSDVVRLPGNGSLGQRFTEFDKHAIYGVHPTDWAYVIAPDIVANDVKVTRDGGKTWHTNVALTAEVLRGGALRMWGGKADFMEVTEIAFDPYNPGRILVGTRDAGIICTADDGRTWRTIYDSDKINYITGFHFHPSGSVYVASYGHGLWQIEATKGCPKTYDFPWDVRPDVNTGRGARSARLRAMRPHRRHAPSLRTIGRSSSSSWRNRFAIPNPNAWRSRGAALRQVRTSRYGAANSNVLKCECARMRPASFRQRCHFRHRFRTGPSRSRLIGQAGRLTADEFTKPFSDEALDERSRAEEARPAKR